MLRIRLTRTGKKNRPHFRIVVAEHSRPVKGKFIEILGHYDPLKKKLLIRKEEILVWLNRGAKPSNTVAKFLVKEGVKHKSIIVKKFHKKSKTKDKKAEKTPKETKPEVAPTQEKATEKPVEKKPENKDENKKVDKK